MTGTDLAVLVQEFEALARKLINALPGQVEYEPLRKHTRDIAQSTANRLRYPYEFTAEKAWAHIQLPVVIIASDLNLFHTLSSAGGPMNVAQIIKKTKADPLLTTRILRFLAAHDLIDQVSLDSYTANRFTKEYVNDHWISVMHTLRFCTPAYFALPEFLKATDYKTPTNPKECAWQLGFNTHETMWEWMQARPEFSDHFNNMMRIPRSGFHESLAEIYPFERLFEASQPDEIIFVDVGGGMGQQCLSLRKTFGIERGRIILQDLPQVVEGNALTDIEVTAHDMMQPQPIIGARAYYFRGVCHDHSDEVCRSFLGQIKKAMNERSRLLIHEELVADMRPSERVTRRDIAMMAQFAAMERSELQIKDLLESIGFKVLGQYSSDISDWKITEASL